MAKKAATSPAKKAPAKRKPRQKKPVEPVEQIEKIELPPHPVDSAFVSAVLFAVPCLISLVIGLGAGIWSAGGIEVGPGPAPQDDCLSKSYAADRTTQVAVLRELAAQPFDGTTDDGRKQAGEWFNTNRFKSRADDYGVFTDAVAEAIAANSEEKLAAELEGK